MGLGREDWVISMDVVRRIYSKCPDNRESLTAMECINGVGGDIPPMLILTGIQQLAPWFSKDLSDDIAVATAETAHTNDICHPRWIIIDYQGELKMSTSQSKITHPPSGGVDYN